VVEAVLDRPTVSGDLGLFGLPNLLQNLADSRLSGALTITGKDERPLAEVRLVEGHLVGARCGPLEGETALYQLMEKPSEGHFIFESVDQDAVGEAVALVPMVTVLLEGMRRYDELVRAVALVPDGARHTSTSAKPTLPKDEADRELARTVWKRVLQGATAAESETDLAVDSYRIRRLLEHWVAERSLVVKESPDS